MTRACSALSAIALCGLLGCSGTDLPGDSADPTSAHPLTASRYDFCHNPRPLRRSERRFCALLDDEAAARCPGLRASCDGEAEPPSGCSGDRQPPESAPPTPPSDTPLDTPGSFAIEGLGAIVRWTLALLLAVALVGVISLVVRALTRRTAPPKRPVSPRAHVTRTAVEPDARPELVRPVDDLLARARSALDAGQADEALLFARGAALRGLADRGALRLHASRTDREYVRSLPRDADGLGALRQIVAAVERVRWGRHALDLDEARQLVDVAARIATVVSGVLLFIFLLSGGSVHANDEVEPEGLGGLIAVFRDAGFAPRVRLRALDSIDDEISVILVDTESVPVEEADWTALTDWVQEGGLLIVLGGQTDGLRLLGPSRSIVGSAGVEPLRLAPNMPAPIWPDGPRRVFTEGADHLWIETALGDVVWCVEFWGDGFVVGLSDADPVRNGGLIRDQNVQVARWVAEVAMELRRDTGPGRPRLELVYLPPLTQDPSPIQSLSNARILPLLLQGLLLLGLAGLWRGWPFAPLRAPADSPRRSFTEHAEALGARYADLGATRHVASASAELWLHRLGPVGLQAAAERTGLSPERARELVERARALAEHPDGPDAADDLTFMEDLWTITKTHP